MQIGSAGLLRVWSGLGRKAPFSLLHEARGCLAGRLRFEQNRTTVYSAATGLSGVSGADSILPVLALQLRITFHM
jgi:hypothetical protein